MTKLLPALLLSTTAALGHDSPLAPVVTWPYDQTLCVLGAFIIDGSEPSLLLIPRNSRTARAWAEENPPHEVDITELTLVDLFGRPAVYYESHLYVLCDSPIRVVPPS